MNSFTGGNKTLFAERMLEAGFIPEGIPPSFRVENMHEAFVSIGSGADYITGKSPTEVSPFNSSKRNRQRRIFGMPNPVTMIDCFKFFYDKKDEIDEHFGITKDSCSIPSLSPDGDRALRIYSFSDFYLKRRQTFSSSRYIVKCDVSRFFHSIYTHCIPWALHGKAASKADRKVDSATIFGNRLDYIIRQGQDGQTVGIPVGPDFSR